MSAAAAAAEASPPAGPDTIMLKGSHPVRVCAVELVGTREDKPSAELKQRRREARQQWFDGRLAALQTRRAELADMTAADPAAASKELKTLDDELQEHKSLVDEQGRFVHNEIMDEEIEQPVLTLVPAQEMRTKPYVLERRLEPLLRVRRMSQLASAEDDVDAGLSALNVHHGDMRMRFQLTPMRLVDQADAEVPGNTVRIVQPEESRNAQMHPTFLERLAAGIRRAGWGGATSNEEVQEVEEEDEEDEQESRGGMPRALPPAPLPLKLTVILPCEKTRGARIGVDTQRGNMRGTRSLNAAYTNLLGRGDRWELMVEQGIASKPLDLRDTSLRLSVSAPDVFVSGGNRNEFGVEVDKTPLIDSSMQQSIRAAHFRWESVGGRRGVKHAVEYRLAHRELSAHSERLADEHLPAPEAASNGAGAAVRVSPPPAPGAATTVPHSWSDRVRNFFAPAAPVATEFVNKMGLRARWREPSPSVMALLGGGLGHSRSVKSSIKYSYTNHGALDNRHCPTQGWSVDASTELAGVLGVGDTRFVRLEANGKYYVPLLRSYERTAPLKASLGFGGMVQYVHNLSSMQPRVFFTDRLFFGHPLILRGFNENVAGPHDGADALGGEFCAAGAVHIGFGVPRMPGVRANLFWNAGNLLGISNMVSRRAAPGSEADVARSTPLAATLPRSSLSASRVAGEFLATTRQSVGVGIVAAPSGLGRFEFNASIPLASQPQDNMATKWPLSFGFGIQWV